MLTPPNLGIAIHSCCMRPLPAAKEIYRQYCISYLGSPLLTLLSPHSLAFLPFPLHPHHLLFILTSLHFMTSLLFFYVQANTSSILFVSVPNYPCKQVISVQCKHITLSLHLQFDRLFMVLLKILPNSEPRFNPLRIQHKLN